MAKIGYAKKSIILQGKVQLAGYNERAACGVHDDIYCKTIVLAQAGELFCFAQFDLLCLGDNFLNQAKEMLQKEGFKAENIILGAIHTHSAPKGLCHVGGLEECFGYDDEEYIAFCLDVLKACVINSKADMQDFTLVIAKTAIKDICSERHDVKLPFDDRLWKIEFNLVNGKKVILYNFTCHPTVLHADNLLISSDYVGVCDKELAKDYDFALFYNGSAGDVSTRFTRQASSFKEVERIGQALAAQIKNNSYETVFTGKLQHLKVHDYELELASWDHDYVLAFKDYLQTLDQKSALYQEALGNYHSLLGLEAAQTNRRFTLPFKIISLNTLKIVTIPAEITSSLTLGLTRKHNCLIFAYVDGYNVYIADHTAYDKHHYEAAVTKVKKGEGERLIRYIEKCLQELRD